MRNLSARLSLSWQLGLREGHLCVIDGRSSLNDHASREYCAQAGETDLDLPARLAAVEGLLYTFEHRADGLRYTEQVRTARQVQRDYTFMGTACQESWPFWITPTN